MHEQSQQLGGISPPRGKASYKVSMIHIVHVQLLHYTYIIYLLFTKLAYHSCLLSSNLHPEYRHYDDPLDQLHVTPHC